MRRKDRKRLRTWAEAKKEWDRDNLADWYVRGILKNKYGDFDIPDEIMELKRTQILLIRKIREIQDEIKQVGDSEYAYIGFRRAY